MSQEKRHRGSTTFLAPTRPLTCCSLSSSTKKREQHNETQSLQYVRNSVSSSLPHPSHELVQDKLSVSGTQRSANSDTATQAQHTHSGRCLGKHGVGYNENLSHVTHDACPTSSAATACLLLWLCAVAVMCV